MAVFEDFKNPLKDPSYIIDVDWRYLEVQLTHYDEDHCRLNFNPEYQRGRVWTREQQIEYVEYKIRGGIGADIICLNVPGLRGEYKPKTADLLDYQGEVVDGLQRLTAVLEFKKDMFPIFGDHYCKDLGRIPSYLIFKFKIGNFWHRREVLTWYLAVNSKGTPHSVEEIERVRKLLDSNTK